MCFFQAEDGIRYWSVAGVQTCALPIFVEENNLAQNISMLRRVLGEGGGGGSLIETVPRRGYRFVGPVEERSGRLAEEVLEARSAAAERDISAIAVLPFADMSPGRDQDYLCEGLAEEL